MAFSLRMRPRQATLLGVDVVEKALLVAMRPDRLRNVPESDRTVVKTVAEALTSASKPEIPPRIGHAPTPLPVVDVARKAAQQLQTGRLVVTPENIEVAMRRQGMDFVEPFAPGRPLTPYFGYDKRPRQYNYMPGRNITTETRPDRIPFATLKQIFEGYDIASICLAAGSLIVTKRGLVPIEDVRVGDEVLTHMGRFRRVHRTTANPVGDRPVVRMQAGGLDAITLTADHPVLAARYKLNQSRRRIMRELDWVGAGDLRIRTPGNCWQYDAAVLPAMQMPDDASLDVAAWLGDGFYVEEGCIVRHGAGSGRFVSIPATVPMSAALGRALGWYMAEGWQSHGRSVSFALGPNEEHIAKQILVDIEECFGITGTYAPNGEGRGRGYCVHVSSSAVARLFASGTARTKKLPEWAWGGSREFFGALLDAWAEGDGARLSRAGWADRRQVVTASYDLAWQMRIIATALGYKPSILRSRNLEGSTTYIRGRAVTTGPTSYQVGWGENPLHTGRYSFETGADGERVLATAMKSVTPVEFDGLVYNIEVEDDHSYVTTGGTVHNCSRHIINDIRSMGLLFKPVDGYQGKVDADIAEAKRFLRKPDGKRNFNTWFAAWAMDVLRYDAGCLWKERNRGNKVTGLKTIDGTTVAPVIDFYGDIPEGNAPAFQQIIQGVPWVDLPAEDVIYEPQWPVPESPYGVAPIETCLINANTDVRLQMFFLEFFTSGSVPEMLLQAPPEMSDADAIAELQETWDNWYQNNQAGRHGGRYIPNGTEPFVYKPYTFDPKLAEYVARRTIAAFGLVPQDLGILDQVNKSSSESQVDTQFRLTTLPNTEYYEAILNSVLQDDLQLPVACYFDTGREREDRLMEARAHQVYVSIGAESPDEVRAEVLGKPVDTRLRLPRFFDSARLGPIPIEYLISTSGRIDPETLAPVPGSIVPQPYVPAGNMQPQEPEQPDDTDPKAVDGKPAPKAIEAAKSSIIDAELAAFRRFAKRRLDSGKWRDFTFTHLDPDVAADLNAMGRQACTKAFLTVDRARAAARGEPPIAGLALRAADTGRVLMLQRANTPDDPAAGAIEFPGGHVEDGESSQDGAVREWQEETGLTLPGDAEVVGSWTSTNGVYRGHVFEIPSEADLNLADRDMSANPDGDGFEAILWLDPADLSMNPTVRRELATDAHLAQAAIGRAAKASGADPKAQQRQRRRRTTTAASAASSAASTGTSAASSLRPGPWGHLEALLVAYWATVLAATVVTVVTVSEVAERWMRENEHTGNIPPNSDAADDLARSFSRSARFDDTQLVDALHNLYADAYLAGGKDAADQTPGASGTLADEVNRVDWGNWQPGHPPSFSGDEGFRRLLEETRPIIKGIDGTTKNLIADAVKDGLAEGKSVQQIADTIDAALRDPRRARLIASTEVNRAMSWGSAEMYRANQVGTFDLLTAADPCPICADVAAHNPHPMDDTAAISPLHPDCRCAIAPVIEE